MTVLRSDIERALGDLISNEEGMRFQGLAVVLAKKRWPDLIACERKRDMGADALAEAPFAAEGTGKVLACSITASITKVRSDAEKVKAHFKSIAQMIFATPSPVSNEKRSAWAEEIAGKFGYDLAIMSREDIITSLMDSGNASLLKTHLGMNVEVDATRSELVERVKEAAAEVTAAWSHRLASKPLLELRALRLDSEGRDTAEVLRLSDIAAALLQATRVVLEGPAGRGKTTTLIQLARARVGSGGISFLVDLTAWTTSRSRILQFIAGMPQFQVRSIDAATLARVNTAEHFSFLLNGWNEIGEPEFPHAESALRTLEREFPAAGIIVATRTHHIVPPLPGAVRARLLTLTRRERAAYLKTRLGVRADQLRPKLDGDPVLDDLTRTPLFLSEVTSIFEAGAPIPSTKIGVLAAVTRLVERSDEHRNHLQQPTLAGRAGDYLGELATRMTAQGGVSISEEKARPAATVVGTALRNSGQIATVPDPSSVLGTLCAHHVLERQDYPEVAFRFEHQQFQEFYAAVGIGKHLFEVLPEAGDEKRREFTKLYVNEPAWAEPLRLLADDIRGRSGGTNGTRAIEAGTLLVMMALSVDPVFAAELARLCGPHVWKQVRTAVSDRLRSLYAASDASWRNCALAGMLASGSDDFKDIIEPLVSSDDQQVALGTYRRWDEFHVSSLGPGWRDTVGSWKETARVTFVSELLHHRNVPEVATFAMADPSTKVKEAAIQGLSWIGAEDETTQFLTSLDGPTFGFIVERLNPGFIPKPIRDRAIAVLQQCRAKADDPLARLGVLLKMFEVGAPKDVDHIKEDLGGITGKIDDHRAFYVIRPALDIVREADAPWTSAWVAEKIAGGFLWHESWHNMITAVPEGLEQELLHRLETEDLKHTHFDNIIAVLAAGADASMVERTFAKLCDLRRTIANEPDQRHEFEWAIERQLETLLRALPASISVAGISNCFSKEVDGAELDVITRVFSGVARPDLELREQIDPGLRERFRAYLKNAVVFVLQQDDFYGELKANVGSVLASVGAPEDVTEMRDLIQADIERVRRGRAARARGDRGRLGNGAAMSWSVWHIRAAVKLDPVSSDPLLLDLLNEPEYERDVATELSRLVAPPAAKDGLFRRVDYGRIWEARAGVQEGPHKERRKRYAAALRSRIEAVLKERSGAEHKRPYDYRLRALGVALAAIDSHGSADLVFEVMSLPDEWDNHSRVEAFEALLFNGVALPTDKTLSLMDLCLERRRKHGVQQQEEWLLERYLCLLPFVDDPARGIERMRQLVSELRLHGHQLREVVRALSYCRCDQALPFLAELGSDKPRAEQLGDAWIDAVAVVDSPESRNLLLSFVDPELPGLPSEVSLSRDDALVARLVELARRDRTVKQRLLQLCDSNLPPAKRSLLAQVVGQLGDVEAVSAGLNLIDDTVSTPVPYGILRQLEDAFVEGRPHGESRGIYTLEPRSSNAIRARLFGMATKDRRREKSALRLLGQIEEWRLEYGRPAGEPRHPAFDLGEPWPRMSEVE
jgi:hypothetical protein